MDNIGVTMVGIHYEELKLRQKEIEVKALVALLKRKMWAKKAEERLVEIAFPEKLADKLEQENKKQTKFFTEELIRNKASDLEGD